MAEDKDFGGVFVAQREDEEAFSWFEAFSEQLVEGSLKLEQIALFQLSGYEDRLLDAGTAEALEHLSGLGPQAVVFDIVSNHVMHLGGKGFAHGPTKVGYRWQPGR